MGSYSFKAVDVHIGPIRWDGFAAEDGHRRALARRCAVAGGPRWGMYEPVAEEWHTVLESAREIAQAGVEAAADAADGAERALWLAQRGRFDPAVRLPSIAELRELHRPPLCRVRLDEVRIELTLEGGRTLSLDGRGGAARVRGESTPMVRAAAVHAHHLAFNHAAAGLMDAAAQGGGHVPASTDHAFDLVFGPAG
ncbi:MAG: hypothetical protein JWM98_1657 [Thermoleophilia bacterium]|nr:hypothetical protein [Thermoleophilia bacterium]